MSASAKAYLFLVITTLGWAANSVVGKFAVGHVSPLTLTALRLSVALICILAISVPQVRADWPAIRRHWLLMLGLGMAGFTLFNALLYSALNYTSAINCVIEQAGIPGLIFIGNFVLFRTKVRPMQILGYSVTLFGVVMTATHGSLQTLLTLTFNFGDVLMLGTCLVYAVYTVGLRWKPDIHWKSLMAATTCGGLVAALPLVGWEAAAGRLIVPDQIGWMAVLFTGLIPSLMSQILYVRGVEMIGPNRAGLFINLVPVFGTLLSVVFLGEPFQTFHWVALSLVLGGIAVAEWRRR